MLIIVIKFPLKESNRWESSKLNYFNRRLGDLGIGRSGDLGIWELGD